MNNINFWQNHKRKQPVREYLDSLNNSKNPKERELFLDITTAILCLNSPQNFTNLTGLVKKLKGFPLWELKIKSIRILYCTFDNGAVFLLHMFVKDSNKTPARHIKTAMKRYKCLKKFKIYSNNKNV